MGTTARIHGVIRRIGLIVIVATLAFAAGLLPDETQAGESIPPAYGGTIYALMTQNFLPDDPFSPLPQTSVEVVDAGTMDHIRTVPLGQRDVQSLAVSPDESIFYVADLDAGVAVLNGNDGSIITTIALSVPRDAVLTRDGSTLFVTAGTSIVEIDTATNTVADTFPTGADQMLGIALSPDGSALAAVSTDGGFSPAMYVADPDDLQGAERIPLTTVGCTALPGDVTFTDTGRALAWDSNCDRLYQVDVPGQVQLTDDTINLPGDSGASFNFNNVLSYSTASDRAYTLKESAEVGVMDPAAVNGSTLGGFSGLPFVASMTPNGKDLLVSVIHRFSKPGGADTLDRLDTATGIFTRDVYTFTEDDRSVRDMRIIGPAVITQGDVDCNGGVSSVDALKLLRDNAALSVTQTEPCPGIGSLSPLFGDVDCSGGVNSVDALKVLRDNAALSVTQVEPCPDIGTAVN
jgi:DNA-binding beta-propeller fold protein YncE